MPNHIAAQLEEIRSKVQQSALSAGRAPESVKLIAVSKTFPAQDILTAVNAGQISFGENKAQELEQKAAALPESIEWHFIGHVQSNKSAKILQYANWIHSVDSLKLLTRINRQAGESGKHPNILLEINLSGESSKTGATVDEAEKMLQAAAECSYLRVAGLMSMPPLDANEPELRSIFGTLRKLRDQWQKKYQIPLPELSIGMSNDFTTAIAEGSTMVRIGTAIFGKRDYDQS